MVSKQIAAYSNIYMFCVQTVPVVNGRWNSAAVKSFCASMVVVSIPALSRVRPRDYVREVVDASPVVVVFIHPLVDISKKLFDCNV